MRNEKILILNKQIQIKFLMFMGSISFDRIIPSINNITDEVY